MPAGDGGNEKKFKNPSSTLTESIPSISIEIDKNNEYGAFSVAENWGEHIPLIKVNSYVVPPAQVISLNIEMQINSLLRFDVTIDDDSHFAKDTIKTNEVNTVIIHIGPKYKKVRLKFQGIIFDSVDNDNNTNITLYGVIYNDKLFENDQYKYDLKTPKYIILDMLKLYFGSKNFGFNVFCNPYILDIKIPEIMNTNLTHWEFIKFMFTNYTNNVFAYDQNHILHVGNLEAFISNTSATFSVIKNNKIDRRKIKVSNKTVTNEDKEIKDADTLRFTKYNIEDAKHYMQKKKYSMFDEKGVEQILIENDLGIGNETKNFFSRFKRKNYTNYKDIVYKQLSGKIYTLIMDSNLYEIYPFMKINVELFSYDKKQTNKPLFIFKKDKIVIGYSFHYRKGQNKITQRIKII